MTKKYDALVFIGRFSPFHNGHKQVIDEALTMTDQVIVLIGSSNRARSIRNPFTFSERRTMIYQSYDGDLRDTMDKITIAPLNDMTYNDNRWIEQVQTLVNQTLFTEDATIGLIGWEKDNSSYYLKLFPTWASESVITANAINATDLRALYWTYGTSEHWQDKGIASTSLLKESVPEAVYANLKCFAGRAEYQQLRIEKDFVEKYKETVKKYPRIEHTVDAVVVQSGHVLLIRRRAEPGKGLWALPGGFVNLDETLKTAMLRELREETKIKVPEAVLRGSIMSSKCYDDPHRSDRGRLITQAFHIALDSQTELPKVKGSDDADKARWVPLSKLNPCELFEDHYFIISDMLGGI